LKCHEKLSIINGSRIVLSNGSALARPWGMRRTLLALVVLKPMRGAMRTKYFLNLGQRPLPPGMLGSKMRPSGVLGAYSQFGQGRDEQAQATGSVCT